MQTFLNQGKGSARILQMTTMPVSSSIPLRQFGKSDVKVSALGLGGHHLGAARDVEKGMAVLSMKSMSGSGESIVHGALTPTEALSHAMAVLDQNLEILHSFKPLDEEHMADLSEHGRQFNDGRDELFKSTLKYDGDLCRGQHQFPTPAELPA
jgi:hypothetical protein